MASLQPHKHNLARAGGLAAAQAAAEDLGGGRRAEPKNHVGAGRAPEERNGGGGCRVGLICWGGGSAWVGFGEEETVDRNQGSALGDLRQRNMCSRRVGMTKKNDGSPFGGKNGNKLMMVILSMTSG